MHKNLPHISLSQHYQFITFRTYDSFDLFAKRILEKENLSTSKKEYELDIYMDNSQNGAYLNGNIIDILKDILFEKNSILYEIVIVAIMPNHIHILLKQLASISEIVKYIKGKSALILNRYLNKNGKFWHTNYFDKVIRDERHFARVYEYIENNPIKASLRDKRVFYG